MVFHHGDFILVSKHHLESDMDNKEKTKDKKCCKPRSVHFQHDCSVWLKLKKASFISETTSLSTMLLFDLFFYRPLPLWHDNYMKEKSKSIDV